MSVKKGETKSIVINTDKSKKPPRQTGGHAKRKAETRSRLLQAAEEIFARDGFEAAKLEDIAAAAGYTRGALYANFDSKSDLFIELIHTETERRMERSIQATSSLPRRALPPRERYRAMRRGFISQNSNRTWNVLYIEFKLFVLRHPELSEKIVEMQKKAFAAISQTTEAIFAGNDLKSPVTALAAGMALGALANTLGVDKLIGSAVKDKDLEDVIAVCFDALSGECRSDHRL